jgi:hypothetical protein
LKGICLSVLRSPPLSTVLFNSIVRDDVFLYTRVDFFGNGVPFFAGGGRLGGCLRGGGGGGNRVFGGGGRGWFALSFTERRHCNNSVVVRVHAPRRGGGGRYRDLSTCHFDDSLIQPHSWVTPYSDGDSIQHSKQRLLLPDTPQNDTAECRGPLSKPSKSLEAASIESGCHSWPQPPLAVPLAHKLLRLAP